MNSIYEYIINNIHQLIITKRYMNENFSYKIPFDDDDRYTFYYSIVNKILVIQLLSVDINYMDTPKIHQEIIDLTTIDFNYYGNFLIYLLNQLNSTFTIKLSVFKICEIKLDPIKPSPPVTKMFDIYNQI